MESVPLIRDPGQDKLYPQSVIPSVCQKAGSLDQHSPCQALVPGACFHHQREVIAHKAAAHFRFQKLPFTDVQSQAGDLGRGWRGDWVIPQSQFYWL